MLQETQKEEAFLPILMFPQNPEEVLYIHDKPVLEPGELGTFDDGGIMHVLLCGYQKPVFIFIM
jgi:hypothetical protein